MSLVGVLGHTAVYRLWQAQFAEQKLSPVLANNDLCRVRRALDVGCGPGTNTRHFAQDEYLGIDFNRRYVKSARRRQGRDFMVEFYPVTLMGTILWNMVYFIGRAKP